MRYVIAAAALLLTFAAMGTQPDEPQTINWTAGDGAKHYH